MVEEWSPMRTLPPVLLCLLACHRESPEAAVARAFQDCVTAVETGDAEPVLKHLHADFAGPEGMDREMARLFLLGTLKREKVGVTVLSRAVEVRGRTATMTVSLILTGRRGGSLLPEESTRKNLVLRWDLRDDKWLLREVRETG
jgi:hypothetical protein